MLIKTENSGGVLLRPAAGFMQLYDKQNRKSDVSRYEDDEEGELEIDLDYNDYVEVGIKEEEEEEGPLDLSMKTLSRRCDDATPLDLHKPKLPRLELKPNFKLFNFETNIKKQPSEVVVHKVTEPESPQENKGTFLTDLEVTKLLDPYVKVVHKKFLCTVCDMKFVNKIKALTHVENKHVDCLVYKCPLCRASKVTRLAFESHLRRGHNARTDEHSPLIKCKKKFCVKSEAQSSGGPGETARPAGGHQYDLQFVTFLRHSLASAGSGAAWLDHDHDQAIFRITNRDIFAKRWFAFKGLETGTWSDVYDSVISEFINRSIFKQLPSDDLVFQVFCIKQLLK